MHPALWHIGFVFHQHDVCENYFVSVYGGGYYGMSQGGPCVLYKLCLVGFLAVCKCSSVLLQSIVMSYVDCGDDG